MTSRHYDTEAINIGERDAMDDFEALKLEFLGKSKTVYTSGSGPAVIVMAEMPGIYAHFLRWLALVSVASSTLLHATNRAPSPHGCAPWPRMSIHYAEVKGSARLVCVLPAISRSP